MAWGDVPYLNGNGWNYGQTQVPEVLTNVMAVAAGYFHNLAIVPAGQQMPPGIFNIALRPVLTISGIPGDRVTVDATHSLSATNHWVQMTNFSLHVPRVLFVDESAVTTNRFYRVRTE